MNVYRKIVLGMIASNSIGAFLIFFYFAYVDLESFEINMAFWQGSNEDWTTLAIVLFVLAIIGAGIAEYYGRKLQKWEPEIAAGLSVAELPPTIRRWAQGYPLLIASLSLTAGLWLDYFLHKVACRVSQHLGQHFGEHSSAFRWWVALPQPHLSFLYRMPYGRISWPFSFPTGTSKNYLCPESPFAIALSQPFC